MVKLLITNIFPARASYRINATLLHVALNTINNVVVLALAWTCVVLDHCTRTYDLWDVKVV